MRPLGFSRVIICYYKLQWPRFSTPIPLHPFPHSPPSDRSTKASIYIAMKLTIIANSRSQHHSTQENNLTRIKCSDQTWLLWCSLHSADLNTGYSLKPTSAKLPPFLLSNLAKVDFWCAWLVLEQNAEIFNKFLISTVLPLKRNQYNCTRLFFFFGTPFLLSNFITYAEKSAVQYNCRFGAKPQATAHKKLILIIRDHSWSKSVIQFYSYTWQAEDYDEEKASLIYNIMATVDNIRSAAFLFLKITFSYSILLGLQVTNNVFLLSTNIGYCATNIWSFKPPNNKNLHVTHRRWFFSWKRVSLGSFCFETLLFLWKRKTTYIPTVHF